MYRPQVSRNLFFMRWKTRNPMSSPIPEHENSRFWLFRDKFVIVEAVLNIIVQATAFLRDFFSAWRFKKSKSNRLPQNRVFLTTLLYSIRWGSSKVSPKALQQFKIGWWPMFSGHLQFLIILSPCTMTILKWLVNTFFTCLNFVFKFWIKM